MRDTGASLRPSAVANNGIVARVPVTGVTGEACAAAVGPQGQLLPAALQRLAAGLALRRADVPLSAIDCTRHASPSLCCRLSQSV